MHLSSILVTNAVR